MNGNTPEVGRKKVLVTGFGPFEGHSTNASWEAVKLLNNLNIEQELPIKLFAHELPVIYSRVERILPKLWDHYRPDVVIHVGVHNGTVIQLEKCAQRGGYDRLDVTNQCPPDGECVTALDDVFETSLDLELLCTSFRNMTNEPIQISNMAGRYLCEYIYYMSLSICSHGTLFVHVPRLNNPYSAMELAGHLKAVISCVLKQVK